MKVLLALMLVSALAISSDPKQKGNIKVCQAYIDQAKKFRATMKDDALSQHTFNFYKEKVRVHCGTLIAKNDKFERKSFTEMMMKSDKTTTVACKRAITMASNYSKNEDQSQLIIAAHKENIVDNCGTLVASHVSSYCLYDESQE